MLENIKKLFISSAVICLLSTFAYGSSVEQKHKEMLYPVVRVRSGKATGSGTVIYSRKDKSGNFHTFVLTNHHVVSDLIKIAKVWDPVLKRKIDKEVLGKPWVEFFEYNDLSRNVGQVAISANIVAYDGAEDLALLELDDNEKAAKFIAKLYPRSEIKNIHLYDEVWASGAALGHAPVVTHGHLSYMDDVIDNYSYWMSTALTIYGNSGGAVFRPSTRGFEFIGIPSLISVVFGSQAITHLGYFVPITRIYGFLERNFYHFIYDSRFTLEKSVILRERQIRESLGKISAEEGVIVPQSHKGPTSGYLDLNL